MHLWQRLQLQGILGKKRYELGTLVSGHFCPFLLAYPCKLRQVGWGASVHSHFQLFPQMFNWIQVWALAGPLKDIHRLSPKPLLCSLGCVLRVIVMLEGKPLPQSEVQSALKQVFFKDLGVLSCIHLSLYED